MRFSYSRFHNNNHLIPPTFFHSVANYNEYTQEHITTKLNTVQCSRLISEPHFWASRIARTSAFTSHTKIRHHLQTYYKLERVSFRKSCHYLLFDFICTLQKSLSASLPTIDHLAASMFGPEQSINFSEFNTLELLLPYIRIKDFISFNSKQGKWAEMCRGGNMMCPGTANVAKKRKSSGRNDFLQ